MHEHIYYKQFTLRVHTQHSTCARTVHISITVHTQNTRMCTHTHTLHAYCALAIRAIYVTVTLSRICQV